MKRALTLFILGILLAGLSNATAQVYEIAPLSKEGARLYQYEKAKSKSDTEKSTGKFKELLEETGATIRIVKK